jgi:response regulator RpfG family c-di-GMP phosphodiesterase
MDGGPSVVQGASATAVMNVLIVDDAPVNVLHMSHLLQKLAGCSVHKFTDPVVALEWSAHNESDLAIIDYMMPEIDGLEFAQRFRALPGKADIPLLMVTADHGSEVRYKALRLGAIDFLNKPLDGPEFLARVKNMLDLRASQKAVAARTEWLSSEVEKATREILARERETLFCLGRAAEYRDPETGAHILRMAHYSRLIAAHLGLSEDEQQLILSAAPMHDIGKLGTPDNILLKPGRLTPEEFEIMKQHAVIGYRILKDSSSRVLQAGAEIAHTHHEKFDGSGYPGGLRGEAIPLHGRIVAVADVFDALTSERPYKKAWELGRALDFLREGSGTHFDPRCVDAFLRDMNEVLAIRERYQDELS